MVCSTEESRTTASPCCRPTGHLEGAMSVGLLHPPDSSGHLPPGLDSHYHPPQSTPLCLSKCHNFHTPHRPESSVLSAPGFGGALRTPCFVSQAVSLHFLLINYSISVVRDGSFSKSQLCELQCQRGLIPPIALRSLQPSPGLLEGSITHYCHATFQLAEGSSILKIQFIINSSMDLSS